MTALNWVAWLILACPAAVLVIACLTFRELRGWSRDLDRFEKRIKEANRARQLAEVFGFDQP